MTFEQINHIASEFGTPFYIMNGEQYIANINAFREAFRGQCKLIIGYSFKTNYIPALCLLAKKSGCYAEVVSEMEYDLARHLGYTNIILNGPIKTKTLLIKALNDHAIINLDASYEVETILEYKKKFPNVSVSIGLRVNIDLSNEEGISKIQNGLRVGRFGFTHTLLKEIIPKLNAENIKIVSIHGHTSSSDRAVENYELIVAKMLKICEVFNLTEIKYFDIGGGFFGAPAEGIDVSNKPKYEDYAKRILDICKANAWFKKTDPYIVIEPGVSVTANVFSYISKIYQKKEINGQRFVITDGTIFDVKPTYHCNNLPYTFYPVNSSETIFVGNLVGSTCMEKDIILTDIPIPESITSGGYIKIDGVGAYTIVLTPTFINYLSPILEIKDGFIRVIRRRQELNDLLSLYSIKQ